MVGFNSTNIVAPYSGVDEKTPQAGVKNPFCQSLLNFNITTAGLKLRNGDSIFSSFNRANVANLNMGSFPYGDTKLIIPIKATGTNFIDFYDAETGAIGYTTGNSLATQAWSTVYFNKYLFFFSNTSTLAPGVFWNGAAYGVCAYTNAGTPGSNLWPIGGNSYNHRIYMIQLGECAYWYCDEVDAIAGSCTKVDLNGIVEQNCTLSSIASFTISNGTTTEEYQSFIMSNGEIIFYKGEYPNSGVSWSLIGRAKVGQPLYVGSVVKFQGDAYLMCDSGFISLRTLFLSGTEQAENLSANSRIQATWRTLVQSIRTNLSAPVGPIVPGALNGSIRGVYDPKTDRIVISFPYRLNSSNVAIAGSFYFVFYPLLQSWFMQRSFGNEDSGGKKSIDDICVYKNGIRLLAQTPVSSGSAKVVVYSKEGSTGYADRSIFDTGDVGYDYEMTSAPVPFAKTGVYSVDGIEPIMKSDLYTQTNWSLVADLGRQSSGNQPLEDQGANIAKPEANVGINSATAIQVKLAGTTVTGKTVGLELYSYNVWYNAGDKGSR